MNETNLSRVQSVSRILVVASTLALVGLGVLALVLTFLPALFISVARQAFPDVAQAATIGFGPHIGTLLASLLPLAAMTFILWHIRHLFTLFSKGEVFSHRPPHHIHRIGWGLIALAGAKFLSHTLAILFLSLGNPPGEKILTIEVSGFDLHIVMFGAMMITLGWVQGAAAALQAENRQFI